MQRLFLFIGIITLITACQHDPLYTPIEEPPVEEPPVEETNCDPNTVYFVNDVLPIIQSNCAFSGCHGNGSAQDGVDLSSYDHIMIEVTPGDPNDSELYEVITESDDDIMPPAPYEALTTEQIQTIRDWILQGAQNNECTDCDLSNVTYAQTVWPIIQNSCTGCHSGSNPQGNLSLTNYNEVVAIGQDGSLMGTINHTSGYIAMPYNGQQLSQCKRDQIQDWVDQGMPNN